MVWEVLFLLVVLKIPIVYLCGVVWYAIRAEPRPEEGANVTVVVQPEPPQPSSFWRRALGRRPRRGGPHGSPQRGPGRRVARTATGTARARSGP